MSKDHPTVCNWVQRPTFMPNNGKMNKGSSVWLEQQAQGLETIQGYTKAL